MPSLFAREGEAVAREGKAVARKGKAEALEGEATALEGEATALEGEAEALELRRSRGPGRRSGGPGRRCCGTPVSARRAPACGDGGAACVRDTFISFDTPAISSSHDEYRAGRARDREGSKRAGPGCWTETFCTKAGLRDEGRRT